MGCKISKLITFDNSLYSFTKCIKNNKKFIPPLSNDDTLAFSDKEKADALAKSIYI